MVVASTVDLPEVVSIQEVATSVASTHRLISSLASTPRSLHILLMDHIRGLDLLRILRAEVATILIHLRQARIQVPIPGLAHIRRDHRPDHIPLVHHLHHRRDPIGRAIGDQDRSFGAPPPQSQSVRSSRRFRPSASRLSSMVFLTVNAALTGSHHAMMAIP